LLLKLTAKVQQLLLESQIIGLWHAIFAKRRANLLSKPFQLANHGKALVAFPRQFGC
jgi:hypothetical protein